LSARAQGGAQIGSEGQPLNGSKFQEPFGDNGTSQAVVDLGILIRLVEQGAEGGYIPGDGVTNHVAIGIEGYTQRGGRHGFSKLS